MYNVDIDMKYFYIKISILILLAIPEWSISQSKVVRGASTLCDETRTWWGYSVRFSSCSESSEAYRYRWEVDGEPIENSPYVKSFRNGDKKAVSIKWDIAQIRRNNSSFRLGVQVSSGSGGRDGANCSGYYRLSSPITLYEEVTPSASSVSVPPVRIADPIAEIPISYTNTSNRSKFSQMNVYTDGEKVGSVDMDKRYTYSTAVLGDRTFTVEITDNCGNEFSFTKTTTVQPACVSGTQSLSGSSIGSVDDIEKGSGKEFRTFIFNTSASNIPKGYDIDEYHWTLYRRTSNGSWQQVRTYNNRSSNQQLVDFTNEPSATYRMDASVTLDSDYCSTVTSSTITGSTFTVSCVRENIVLPGVQWSEPEREIEIGTTMNFKFRHGKVDGLTIQGYRFTLVDPQGNGKDLGTNPNALKVTFNQLIGTYHLHAKVYATGVCKSLSIDTYSHRIDVNPPCPTTKPAWVVSGASPAQGKENVYQVTGSGPVNLRVASVPYLSQIYQWRAVDMPAEGVSISPALTSGGTLPGDQALQLNFQQSGSYTFRVWGINNCEVTPQLITFHVLLSPTLDAFNISQLCPIYLPEDLPGLLQEYGEAVGLPEVLEDLQMDDPIMQLVIKNMRFQVESSTLVVVGPGVVLQDGGQLIVNRKDQDAGGIDNDDLAHNFTEQTLFDDFANIIGQSKQYFDAMGRPVQNQVKDLERGIVLASQTLYDREGRASASSLAAPVRTSTGGDQISADCPEYVTERKAVRFGYVEKLLTNKEGQAYSAFDLYENEQVGQAPGTVGWYYSENQATTPATSGLSRERVATTKYPFVKTLYRGDGSGEVVGQTLPGNFQYRTEEVVIEGVRRNKTSLEHVAHSEMQPLDESFEGAGGDTDIILKYMEKRSGATALFNPYSDRLLNPVFYLQDGHYKQVSEDANGRRSVSYYNEAGQLLTSLYYGSGQSIITQSYSFYDDRGRMVASLDPKELVTKYEYDFRGRLLSMDEPDAGKTEYVYRKDGSIRFSQNSKQREENKYSYTHYDQAGRPTQSGQWSPSDASVSIWTLRTNKDLLEQRTDELPAGSTTDVVKTTYDRAVILPDGITGRTAQFLMGKVSYSEKLSETGQPVSKSWYSYDERGRVTWMVQDIAGLGVKTVDYTYNGQGNVRVVAYQDKQSDAFYHYYEYDADTRLSKVYTSTTEPEYQANEYTLKNLDQFALQASYEYYLHGPLKQVTLADGLQKTDYTYTVQGWLKAINNPNDTDAGNSDVFAMQLDYFSGDYSKAGSGIQEHNVATTDYSGNIQQQQWRTKTPAIANLPGNQAANAYQYQYDERYQLQSAVFGRMSNQSFTADAQQSFSTTGLGYDLNGNILGLQRRGQNGSLLHDFAGKYNYKDNTNQLSSVTGYKSYTYNALGQMTEEIGTEGSQKFAYDVSGKVKEVKDENNQLIAQYQYDDKGYRVSKQSYENGGLVKTTYYVRDASGSLMSTYEEEVNQPVAQTELPIYGGSRVGLYQAVDQRTEYYLTDHLGNTRAIINRERLANGNVDVSYFADYFAYGALARSAGSKPRYGYQGSFAEDETEETGYVAFELRQYDPVVGRWLSTDPYGQYFSPYVGMGNNPANGVDPDGGLFGKLRANVYAFFSGGNVVQDNYGNWLVTQDVGSSQAGAPIPMGSGYLLPEAGVTSVTVQNFGLSGLGGTATFANSTVMGAWAQDQWATQVQYDELLRYDLGLSNGIEPSYPETYFMPTAPLKGIMASRTLYAASKGKWLPFDKAVSFIQKQLVDYYKNEGTGGGARSGRHGTPYIKAGNKLIQMSNDKNYRPEFRDLLKRAGNQAINKGKGINHAERR